jgi:hypothetical protein
MDAEMFAGFNWLRINVNGVLCEEADESSAIAEAESILLRDLQQGIEFALAKK